MLCARTIRRTSYSSMRSPLEFWVTENINTSEIRLPTEAISTFRHHKHEFQYKDSLWIDNQIAITCSNKLRQKPDARHRAVPCVEVSYEQQSKRVFVDTLPNLRRENKDKGIWGYGACKVSALLPQMQERNTGRCCTTENGAEQVSRTQKVQSQLSHSW